MKFLQKLILPVLFVLIVLVVYFLYFAPKDELGSFADFDPNNNAVKEIRVMIDTGKEINFDGHGGATFYVVDKNNTTKQVSAEKVPTGLESATKLILKGHLSGSSAFHAHEVEIE
jgi:hypothetical protein